MICNTSMHHLLNNRPSISTPMMTGYRICRRQTEAGAPYWTLTDAILPDSILPSADLTALEWDCNEVMLDMNDSIPVLLNAGLLFLIRWKEQMERDFPGVPFDIVLSVDEGEEGVPPSVTLRFYGVREGVHIVEPTEESLEKCAQPALLETVNP